MTTRDIISVAFLALLVFWAVGAYNRLVRLKNAMGDAFVAIDFPLKDRHDLVLKLVEAASEYLQHDPSTLTELMQARNTVSSASDAVRARPGNVRLVQALMTAEQRLHDQFDALWAVAADNLALQAEPKIRELAQQITQTQGKLNFACQAFNGSVTQYNTARRQFPTALVSRLFGFVAAVPLSLGESDT
jgi:LemA protein